MSTRRESPFVSPDVAWPTLCVLALALLASGGGAALGVSGAVPEAVAMLICTAGAYLAFTPLHEAAHQSISRSVALNAVVGRVGGVLLMGPFAAVRHFHLEHHRHTNDPVVDPDRYSGRGPWWLLPLRWLTQDIHYYARWLRGVRSRPRAEVLETSLTFALQLLAVVALCMAGKGREALLYWVVPARLAIGFLAFSFDWLPHRPHHETDRYLATRVMPGRALEALLLGQNYHLIHHLYPGVPFYRYRRIWEAQRDKLLARGVRA